MIFRITLCNKRDLDDLVSLLNLTYRSKDSLKGWTSEANLIKGPIRTDASILEKLMDQTGSWVFKCIDEEGALVGCVHLKKEMQRLYLGMLSVQPTLQGHGLGKKMLVHAESWALQQSCNCIYMQVVSSRRLLLDWYKRHGYVLTGERKPFDVDPRYGVPVEPLEFIYLEKPLT